MWLLDVNMPRRVAALLRELGMEACGAGDRGWGALTNGVLVEAAVKAGFRCILTRDRLFGESAARALKRYPEFGVVLIAIPQVRGPEFLARFQSAWDRSPIHPVPGRLVLWPEE